MSEVSLSEEEAAESQAKERMSDVGRAADQTVYDQTVEALLEKSGPTRPNRNLCTRLPLLNRLRAQYTDVVTWRRTIRALRVDPAMT